MHARLLSINSKDKGGECQMKYRTMCGCICSTPSPQENDIIGMLDDATEMWLNEWEIQVDKHYDSHPECGRWNYHDI